MLFFSGIENLFYILGIILTYIYFFCILNKNVSIGKCWCKHTFLCVYRRFLGVYMAKTIAIGIQSFEDIIKNDYFYIDKTPFIKEWWEGGDSVTLIARPRRFGKTLNMSMVECFFSTKYKNGGDIFKNLSIWQDEKYRSLQGTYPVITLSFANIKENNFEDVKSRIGQVIADAYSSHWYLVESNILRDNEKKAFLKIVEEVDTVPDTTLTMAVHKLTEYLYRYFGKKVIILLDEYDTPMQEAYIDGYWDEFTVFIRSMFNSTFKTNPYMERAIMTGITRVSKESIFSDLNNLEVITTTSEKYETAFGFTEKEVFDSMDEMEMSEKDKVKYWYDGFVFGKTSDIYNPWSILNYLDKGKFSAYWANTSSNKLVGKLLREGNQNIKGKFETLIQGGEIEAQIDEQIVYNQLGQKKDSIWSLLLASGYLKVVDVTDERYVLKLTNYEVKRMFRNMIQDWFTTEDDSYNEFVKALLLGDIDAMNEYMNRVTDAIFSSFDTGKSPSRKEPERFYHGFVLGLIVDLRGKYIISSNRESGFGRYDVMLEPLGKEDAIIIEFKVYNPRTEKSMEDTLKSALNQIESKNYAQTLINRGIAPERIRRYGFVFEGKKVLIGE